MAPRGGRPDSASMWDEGADNHDRPRDRDRRDPRSSDRGRTPREDTRDRARTPNFDSKPRGRNGDDGADGPPRSPHERGGRRNHDRYGGRDRSRSPHRRGGRRYDRDNRDRSRSADGRDSKAGGRNGRDDPDRSTYRDREPPKGPRGGASYRGRGAPPVKAPAPAASRAPPPKEEKSVDVIMEECPEDMDPDEWMMKKMMGFSQFKSTKETKVPGNDKNYGVRKEKTMAARQYMNRQGGFNRPLSPSRE